jgi:hypothetical protein
VVRTTAVTILTPIDDELPKWLPETHISLSFMTYGLEQLIGAIKVRAERPGHLSMSHGAPAPSYKALMT